MSAKPACFKLPYAGPPRLRPRWSIRPLRCPVGGGVRALGRPFGANGLPRKMRGGSMADFWVWWILGALLVGLELATGTFYLLAVGIAFGLGGVAALLGAPVTLQLIIGGIMSAIALGFA